MVSVGIPDESELMKGEAPTKRKKKSRNFGSYGVRNKRDCLCSQNLVKRLVEVGRIRQHWDGKKCEVNPVTTLGIGAGQYL